MNKQDILAIMLVGLAYGIFRLVPGIFAGHQGQQAVTVPVQVTPVVASGPAPVIDTQSWFQSMKPYCNAVEVETRLRQTPAPSSVEGDSYSAACLALAGKIASAREIILTLSNDDRWRAAGIVFGIAHPVADAGDNEAAGPIMELVVEFWPNHYMALYHAGAARFEMGDHGEAEGYLNRFLDNYEPDDGWRKSAISMLETIGEGC